MTFPRRTATSPWCSRATLCTPHMTVYKNIAFGLELRKTPKDKIDKRVHEAAKILEIKHLLDRNGDTVRVAFDLHKVHLFDIETEQTILNEAAIM